MSSWLKLKGVLPSDKLGIIMLFVILGIELRGKQWKITGYYRKQRFLFFKYVIFSHKLSSTVYMYNL